MRSGTADRSMSLIQNSFNDRPSLETRTDINYCEPTIRRNLAPSYLRRCVPHLTLLSFHISKIAVFLGLFRPCDVIVDAISCLLVVDPLPDENTGGIPRQFPRAQHAVTVPLPIAETALVHLATCIPEYNTYTAAFCVSVQSPQLWPLQKKKKKHCGDMMFYFSSTFADPRHLLIRADVFKT